MSKSTVFLSQIASFVGQTVSLKGWVYNFRFSGKIAFLSFRDGTGDIQIVALKNALSPEDWQILTSLTFESALEVRGLVKAEPRSPTGFELEAEGITLIHLASPDFPIGKKEHGPKFLLDHRHLWLRTPKQRAIQTVRHEIINAINQFYLSHHFTRTDTPIFTPNACEGTTTLFAVDYFGENAYLSQSGQLYLEAMLPAFNRVYDFSPVFRAEKSKTRRHLTEFWMTNAEMAFMDHHESLKLQEQLIYAVIQHVLTTCQKPLGVLERDLTPLTLIKLPFERLTYTDLIVKLHELGSDIKEGEDLGNDDETLLMQHYQNPVFVEYYPASIKAFYMKRLESDPTYAKCADLLAPEGYGEVIGGSERETDYEKLKAAILSHHLPLTDFSWYLDTRAYGSVPHSGFGIGLERLVAWTCGLKHVRETIPFPRLLNRLRP